MEQIVIAGELRFDEPMQGYTSIGVGGPADVLAFPGNVEELGRLVAFLSARGLPFFPAGNWTNLVVRDGGYRGTVISLRGLHAVRLLGDSAHPEGIYAQAGARLSEIVSLAADHGLAGLEFCAGIPGSVGGALKMNAGAYGREMKDVVEALTVMDREGHYQEYARQDLSFQYRCLELPEGSLVAAASYRLPVGNREEIRAKIRETVAIRKGKHPLEYKNAGSIFKNPVGPPAGRIIEEAGLKGLQVGGAKVSEKHGNFIVNMGNARAKDITDLISMVQDAVQSRKGIHLEPEVVIVGEEA